MPPPRGPPACSHSALRCALYPPGGGRVLPVGRVLRLAEKRYVQFEAYNPVTSDVFPLRVDMGKLPYLMGGGHVDALAEARATLKEAEEARRHLSTALGLGPKAEEWILAGGEDVLREQLAEARKSEEEAAATIERLETETNESLDLLRPGNKRKVIAKLMKMVFFELPPGRQVSCAPTALPF